MGSEMCIRDRDIIAKSKRLFSVFKTSQTDDIIDLILHKEFNASELVKLCDLNL